MAGFNWEEFYGIFKGKLEEMIDCTVGSYTAFGENQLPCVEASLIDNPGGDYDLEGEECSRSPLIEISVYCSGDSRGLRCCKVSEAARTLMDSYGFQCRSGPGKAESPDADTERWAGRYQRVFGNGDRLEQLE